MNNEQIRFSLHLLNNWHNGTYAQHTHSHIPKYIRLALQEEKQNLQISD